MARAKALRPSRVLSYTRAHRSAMRDFLARPTLPPWYAAMVVSPPSQTLVREVEALPSSPPQTSSVSSPGTTTPKLSQTFRKPKRSKRPSKLFTPAHLKYVEDDLRTTFFGDHPWELARPTTLLSTTRNGEAPNQGRGWDWSVPHEVGRPQDGEAVVQRQRWLMEQKKGEDGKGMGEKEAYDEARKEHYARRHYAAVEARVAAEEAAYYGANFGPKQLDIGMGIEGKMFEDWKGWATEQVKMIEMNRSAAYSGGTTVEAASASAEGGTGEGEDGKVDTLGDAVDMIAPESEAVVEEAQKDA